MIRSYWSERLPARRMAPLVILLAGASQADRPWTIVGLAVDGLLAFLLAAQFRVWDDLADRDYDAVVHPDRVLARSSGVRSVAALCVALGTAGATVVALRATPPRALVVLILLNAAVALCYAVRRARSLVSDHVLLARYAAFVFIISSSSGPARASSLGLAMAAVFLALSLYEGLHDCTSPIARRPMFLACESFLLVVTLVALGGPL